jgi:hypothetical protein
LRLAAGTPCTLRWEGHAHRAEILGVSENTVWTSFPVLGIDVQDQGIDIQLGEDGTGPVFHAQVVIAPQEPGDGIVLRRTASATRKHRRNIWRVPTRLKAEYGVGSGGPWHPGQIANLSLQGALVVGDTGFEVGDPLTIAVHLKTDERLEFPGMVVHNENPEPFEPSPRCWLGVRFNQLSAETTRELTWYLWKRLWKLYPDELKGLYPRSSRRKRRAG